jgi:NAD-dependent oxidoreductase involved in siderophore biosynthesis
MQLPRIHLNGSHGPTLFEQYHTAIAATRDALSALQGIDVNGRDYYVISSQAASLAYAEHMDRCRALRAIISDLSAIAESIADQCGDLSARKARGN